MTFTPKEGMICATRDGQKIGPLEPSDGLDTECGYVWAAKLRLPRQDAGGAPMTWTKDGAFHRAGFYPELDLVAEWVDEPALPVRTRTVTEIVPGIYGSIMVSEPGDYAVFIRMHIEDHGKFMDAAQLRAAARLFVSLAEALEETS